MFQLFGNRNARRQSTLKTTGRRTASPSACFRPRVEALEDRLVLSTTIMAPAAPAFGPALASSHAHRALAPVQMLPLQINSVALQNGQLVANGSLGGTTFQLPLALTPVANPADPSCPILHLGIPQGIHLSLLGLNVDTSGICLNINGDTGNGQLLGNLVCGLANALNPGGAGLLGFLNGLSTSDVNTLLTDLGSILNSALTQATSINLGTGTGATPSVMGPNCSILHLALGPVNLDLLGLVVTLDNCAQPAGPVTVDITATPGAGNLLGNLLCNLSSLLDSHANLRAIENSLGRIANDILTLI